VQQAEMQPQGNLTLPIDETTIANVLQDNGYISYLFGKWNQGNASPKHLPTARGFDYFLGYLGMEVDYWSKRTTAFHKFTDLMYSDADCYYQYDGDDMRHYSTMLYKEKAVSAIENHDMSVQVPMLGLGLGLGSSSSHSIRRF
jgi:arylsulfatase A-like enzyme